LTFYEFVKFKVMKISRANALSMIDIHSHILPGLDDGPDDIGESIRMCRMAADDGIHTIVATPHMLKGIYHFSKKDVLKKVEKLNSAIKAKNIPLTILPGAEIVIDPDILQGQNPLQLSPQ